MKKNAQIHMWLESDLLENLKKQASDNNISLGDLCRQKLRGDIRLDRIEELIKRFEEALFVSQKGGRLLEFSDDKFYKIKESRDNSIKTSV